MIAASDINTRKEALEFARRTRRNLEFIEVAKADGANVHAVTQLTLSLLGLIVFPKEKLLLDDAKSKTIAQMKKDGWPGWTITFDDPVEPTKSLWDIIRHLRNAVAHGRLSFNSDSPHMEGVVIFVEDKMRPSDPEPYWWAHINAHDLRRFCLQFLDFIDQRIG